MFKRIGMLLGICALLVVSGCAELVPYTIEGLQAAGQFGAFDSSSSTAKPKMGKEIEKLQINSYEVSVREGFYKGDLSIIFVAYKNGAEAGWNAYQKNDKTDAAKLEAYVQMDETGKKQFIKSSFLKYGLDLGPIKTETVKEEAPAEVGKFQTLESLSPSFSTPGFAPRSK